jgi:hypothetical protein
MARLKKISHYRFMIIIEPLEGLGNRMRAINSARALSRDLGTRCVVLWREMPVCNCRYSDIFRRDRSLRVVEGSLAHLAAREKERFCHRIFTQQEIRGIIGKDSTYHTPAPSGTEFFRALDPGLRTYLKTYEAFYPSRKFGPFVPVPPLGERIREITAGFDDTTIGVHIRRTDNMWSSRHSPTAAFIRCMEDEIRQNSDTVFFLATDSAEDERAIRSRFDGRIITGTKTLSRESADGIRDAVVDMFCLASTRRIYGSWCSSFSSAAAALGGAELVTVYE